MSPEELVAATAGSVNALGAKYYFDPATLSRGKELGLDGFRYYVIGRGGVLGNVEPPVVTSAFGYFAPAVIEKMWNSAREKIDPRDAARSHFDCIAELGRARLGDVDGLESFCEAADKVIGDQNPAGLSLFAGVAAESRVDDLPGRALQQLVVLRELRGSQHLAVVVATGLHASVAHALRRPDDIETFGWPADVGIPDGSAEQLAEIDRMTDAINADSYRTLTDGQRQAFAAGVTAIEAAFE